MIVRSMFAGAALFVLAAVPTAFAEPSEAKGPLKVTEKKFTDDAGNTLEVRFDDSQAKGVKVKATDKQGKPLAVVEIPLKDMTVCLPPSKGAASGAAAAEPAKPLCQPLTFVTEGAFLKMGTATCRCQVYSGYVYCYGDTCG
jgi:hypothetical protein